MRTKIYYQYGALNSRPVLDAVRVGLEKCGHTVVESGEDLAVIWSVLWMGRMQMNQQVYDECKKHGIPVMIVEVGNLQRNFTWRLSLDNVNGFGTFANITNLDPRRPEKLKLSLKDINTTRQSHIVLACQHRKSLQWQGMPSTEQWIIDTVAQIKRFTDRKIVVRPHPRNPIRLSLSGVTIESPRKIKNSYDDYDIDYNCHCLVNYNSGPGVQSAIHGTPVVCDPSSLAYPVSDQLSNIENISLPDRTNWFVQLCHTEWTIEEIQKGIPIDRLFPKNS